VAAADTDEAGRYAIEGLADAEHTAVATGYSPTASTLHVTGGEGPVWAPWRGEPSFRPRQPYPQPCEAPGPDAEDNHGGA
jgi:hypothetical protein